MSETEYETIFEYYRMCIIERIHNRKLTSLRGGLLIGKLDEWEAEYKRKGGV